MLKDRVRLSEKGFSVFQDSEDDGRRVFFRKFTLMDDGDEGETYQEIAYWQPGKLCETTLELGKSCYISVVEKKNEQIVDTYCFFHSGGNAKGELQITIKPKRFYGKGAHMITVEWVDCASEAINSKYIGLQNEETKEIYHFLNKYIEALNPDGKKLQDRYIFVLPEGYSLEQYTIWVDFLVKEKYKIEL